MAKRVLIVDDESVVREVLRVQLEGWGFEVAAASTLEKGVELAASLDLAAVICDAALPDGPALEIVMAARGRSEPIPVLLAAELWSSEHRARVEEQGAIAVRRPFDWEELRRMLAAAPRSAGGDEG